MKITSTGLAKGCVAFLVINPLLSIPVWAALVWASLAPDSHGILAALFAANAVVALFAGFVFSWPEFSRSTTAMLRLSLVVTGVGSGLLSAVSWMAGEVDRSWLPVVFISPVAVILLVLIWFVRKAEKEGTKQESE